MRTKQFWWDLGERSVRTFAQALGAALLALSPGAVVQLDVRAVDWATTLSIAAGAALLSALMSLGGTKRGNPETASLLSTPKQ